MTDPTRAKDGGEKLWCTACGEMVRLPLPMPLDVWLAAAKAFQRAHRRCVAPADKGEANP
jgi:hypothetical protein